MNRTAIAVLAVLYLSATAPARAAWNESDDIEQHEATVFRLLNEGAVASNGGEKRRALELYLSALELAPEDEDCLQAVASTSYDLNRYQDAAWAWSQIIDHMDLKTGTYQRYAISLMVLGDYAKAFDVLSRAQDKFGADPNVESWRLVAAYGTGRWDMVMRTLNTSPAFKAANQGENLGYRCYDIIFASTQNMIERAQTAGLKYPLLTHLSQLYCILERGSQFGGKSRDELSHAAWKAYWDLIYHYRSLPLKPMPPRDALEAATSARNLALQRDWGGADRAYQKALHLAPWWPELHYNYAVFAENSFYTQNGSYDGELYSNQGIAAQELIFYAYLDPGGSHAKDACRKLKKWGIKCPEN